jgi:hypothetical protein
MFIKPDLESIALAGKRCDQSKPVRENVAISLTDVEQS